MSLLLKLRKYKEIIAIVTSLVSLGGQLAASLLTDICDEFIKNEDAQMKKLNLVGNALVERQLRAMDIYTCCNLNKEVYKTNYKWNDDASKCLPVSSNS